MSGLPTELEFQGKVAVDFIHNSHRVMVYAQYVINIAKDVGVIMYIVLRSSHGFQP
jgi:hypothetical protein